MRGCHLGEVAFMGIIRVLPAPDCYFMAIQCMTTFRVTHTDNLPLPLPGLFEKLCLFLIRFLYWGLHNPFSFLFFFFFLKKHKYL